MGIRKIAGRLHLVVGLLTGAVFALVCLTGAIVAFTEEALNVANRAHLGVPPQDKPRVPPERVLEAYKKAYPDEQVFVFNAYRDADRSYDFFSASLKPGTEDDFGGYRMAYADPYSGEILHVDRGTLDWIVKAVELHTTLMLGDFGHELIKYCTLFFLVQLLAGLVLWWPRSRAALKAATRLAWNSGPRRRLYDSHRTVGFWASAGLLTMVLTSLVMSWGFVAKPVAAAFGGEPSLMRAHDEERTYPRRKDGPEYSLGALADRVLAENPSADQITFNLPYNDTMGILTVRTHSGSTFLNFAVGRPTDYDRVTGAALEGFEADGERRNAGILAMNLLIHMGFWGGTPTKVLYFLLGILGASLPVTGYVLWRGKRKRRRAGLPDADAEADGPATAPALQASGRR